ncbi:MAG: hypothetical protein JWN04_6116 [Myxococcaceae bacterium]|nr:hypothetical protein [Myxococcaceae bacterium]
MIQLHSSGFWSSVFPAVLVVACSSSSSVCEDLGGMRVHGICQCPPDTQQSGSACVPSSSSRDDSGLSKRDSEAERAPGMLLDASTGGDGSSAMADGGRHDDADLATNGAEPEADSATPEDSAPLPFRCAPMGEWTSSLREHAGGTCNAGIAPFVVQFHGTLADAMKAETACEFTFVLSDDGCTMHYDQLCPIDAPNQKVREVGTVTMTSRTHVQGVAHVTVEEPGLPLDMECMSDVDVVADANMP